MKKKITILALHLGYGGVEKSICALANLLASNENYKVKIVSIYKLYDSSVFKVDERVEIKYLLDSSMSPNRKEWKSALHNFKIVSFVKESIKGVKILNKRRSEVINYLKNSDDDVVIATRIFLNELLGEYGNNDMIKIGWEHNHYHNNMKYATDVVRSSKNLDYLVLVSKSLHKFYRKQMRNYKTKCVYIPNVIEKMPRTKSPLTGERLITVGRLAPEKGYFDLLVLYNDLKKNGCTWKLDIVGDGVERERLENYIKRNNLSDDVILHGFKNSNEIEKLMHKASIYIMTSYTESFGIVLLEAMSNGLPCLAFDSAEGAREIITSGRDGYLIRNRNFKAMEKKVFDLIKNPKKLHELGANGRCKVKAYLPDVIRSSWEKIIEKK